MNAPKAANTEPIPGYRLVEPLGRGGFGEVWTCEAPGGLLKAIKFVRGETDDIHPGSNGAQQELQALQHVKGLRHPFLLSMDRVEFVDGELVIVMELADRSLHDMLEEYRSAGAAGIPREELLRYLAEAAEVLDLLNQEHGLQHLDVKPRNLFLVGRHIKVADFGLVNSLAEMNGSTPKAVLMGAVTPIYASPESLIGKITSFCDQYSLAITYHELLVGQPPFIGKNFRQLALQHMQAEPDLSRLPEADRPIVARALAKEPQARFPSCSAFTLALQTAGAGELLLAAPTANHRNERETRADILVSDLSSTPVGSSTKPPGKGPPTEIVLVEGPTADPLDGYQFLKCIAHTAAGETWKARSGDGRDCLIRFLSGINGLDGDRQREGRLAVFRSLRHDGLERTEIVGGGAHRLALITDSCTTTLGSRFQECRAAGLQGIPRPELVAYLMEAAEILDDLFAQYGVAHLGLTPNQLVLRAGSLQLRHFGVVELIYLPAGQRTAALNPRYAAPELLEGNLQAASDAYSLAVIFCEMLTGVHPLGNAGPRRLASSQRPIQMDLSLVPAADRFVLQRALHVDPSQRFASCTDFVAALGDTPVGPATATTGDATDPTYDVVLHDRMRQLINSLVAEAAGDLEVREFRDTHYLLRPGHSLEQQFFARLMPGVAKLKVQGFSQQWGATELEVSDQCTVLFVPLTGSFWKRMVGIRPGLKIQIGIPQEAAAVAISAVRVTFQPIDCDRKTALTLLEETAPQLLDSFRTFFQAQPDRRSQARLPFEKDVEIIPVLEDYTEGDAVVSRAQDISGRGMKIHMPCQPRSQQVNIRLPGDPSDPLTSLPASVVRSTPSKDGGYEVGLRFLIEDQLQLGEN